MKGKAKVIAWWAAPWRVSAYPRAATAAGPAPPSDILEFGQLEDDRCGELDADELVVAADEAPAPAMPAASQARMNWAR